MNSILNRLGKAGRAILILLFISSCNFNSKPEPTSESLKNVVSDFYLSLAAIQADEALFAIEKMESVVNRYPKEAAAWANLGLFAMRQGDYKLASERLTKAVDLAPDNSNILFLIGLMESRAGNIDQSVQYLQKAYANDSLNVKAAFTLAQELERQDAEAHAEKIISLYQSILEEQKNNTAVLLELLRVAAKLDRQDLLNETIEDISSITYEWNKEILDQFTSIQQLVEEQKTDNLAVQITFLRNMLNQQPGFQQEIASVQIASGQVGFPITQFSWLPQPDVRMAPKDESTSFEFKALAEGSFDYAKAISVTERGMSDFIAIREGLATLNNTVDFSFPGKPLSKHSIATIDFDYDFRNDLAFAGTNGFTLYQQQKDSTFKNITASLGLTQEAITENYQAVWSRDIDLDGDLDLVLSPLQGPVKVFRNNGDGTFKVSEVFSQVANARAFLWADFDRDADSDALFLTDKGKAVVLWNERSVIFSDPEAIPGAEKISGINVADIDSDGQFDIIVQDNEHIRKFSFDTGAMKWSSSNLVSFQSDVGVEADLLISDLDNNGGQDLLISAPGQTNYWLSDKGLSFSGSPINVNYTVQSLAELSNDYRLDMLALDADGQVVLGSSSGAKDYAARFIRPRASGPQGDQRINSFGIGGHIEARSGLLYQKKLINESWVHFGIGNYNEAEMLRIIWPNGSSQTEFAELGYDSEIINEQFLKGSCPWLFAYNGEEMEFVTDFIWRSPLGLRINAQTTAGVVQTEDRVKISGNQLAKKDGYYELRITADLWETHFFDHVSLMSVDHPKETEIFIDERFAIPSPDLRVRPTASPQPVASVTDDKGNDVTEAVNSIDKEYLYSFDYTKYQGVAEDHYIEIDLGKKAPKEGPLWLLAHGWVRPTDSSINFAISQGNNPEPKGISLEVSDGEGGWKQVKENLGFPAGKAKTVMIDLQDIFIDPSDKRIRLHTTTETYWDAIQWAKGLPGTEIDQQTLDSEKMELRYRGFSEITQVGMMRPEMPNYQNISGTTPKWYDLEGFYTRFGDITELLQQVDDRYVIMNAGDEMVLRFAAPKEPKEGWVRDFVLIGDGWVKDGDYNTKFSKTVLPLPSHSLDQYQYDEAPKRLEDDPVYQQHASDWINYHTRYITPKEFQTALRFKN